jgi:hypothetical protein
LPAGGVKRAPRTRCNRGFSTFCQLAKRAVDVVPYEQELDADIDRISERRGDRGSHGDLVEQALSSRNLRMECPGCEGTIVSH